MADETNKPGVTEALTKVLDDWAAGEERRALFNLNLQRQAAGLPPIDANGAEVSAFALSPQTTQWLKLGGIVLGVYWLAGALAPSRRRR